MELSNAMLPGAGSVSELLSPAIWSFMIQMYVLFDCLREISMSVDSKILKIDRILLDPCHFGCFADSVLFRAGYCHRNLPGYDGIHECIEVRKMRKYLKVFRRCLVLTLALRLQEQFYGMYCMMP